MFFLSLIWIFKKTKREVLSDIIILVVLHFLNSRRQFDVEFANFAMDLY